MLHGWSIGTTSATSAWLETWQDRSARSHHLWITQPHKVMYMYIAKQTLKYTNKIVLNTQLKIPLIYHVTAMLIQLLSGDLRHVSSLCKWIFTLHLEILQEMWFHCTDEKSSSHTLLWVVHTLMPHNPDNWLRILFIFIFFTSQRNWTGYLDDRRVIPKVSSKVKIIVMAKTHKTMTKTMVHAVFRQRGKWSRLHHRNTIK